MHNSLPENLGSFIWYFLKRYKIAVICFICIAGFAGCWGPFNSILIKIMINDIASPHFKDIASLSLPAVLLVLNFIVFDNFTWRSIGFLNYKYQAVIKNQIINETFGYVLGANHEFFLDNLSVVLQITLLPLQITSNESFIAFQQIL